MIAEEDGYGDGVGAVVKCVNDDWIVAVAALLFLLVVVVGFLGCCCGSGGCGIVPARRGTPVAVACVIRTARDDVRAV